MKTKSFEAVKFMRNRRDELSEKYLRDPDAQEKELSRVRSKYLQLKRTVVGKRKHVALVGIL